jgi:L-amino acid N-acyltransferase YncA
MPVMSNEITVRDAVAGDAGGICAIYNEAIAERGSTFETASRFAADFQARIDDLIGKLFTDNVASIRLVERCGFDAVGLHRRHGELDGAWRDVLVVERLLERA